MWLSTKHEWTQPNADEWLKLGYVVRRRWRATDTYRLYRPNGSQVMRDGRKDTFFQTAEQAKYIGDRLIDGYALELTEQQERQLRYRDFTRGYQDKELT